MYKFAKPRYKYRWQVIFTKYGKELYNKVYDATTFEIDIAKFTHWSRDYKEEIIYKENGLFDTIKRYKDNLIVKILMLREEI